MTELVSLTIVAPIVGLIRLVEFLGTWGVIAVTTGVMAIFALTGLALYRLQGISLRTYRPARGRLGRRPPPP